MRRRSEKKKQPTARDREFMNEIQKKPGINIETLASIMKIQYKSCARAINYLADIQWVQIYRLGKDQTFSNFLSENYIEQLKKDKIINENQYQELIKEHVSYPQHKSAERENNKQAKGTKKEKSELYVHKDDVEYLCGMLEEIKKYERIEYILNKLIDKSLAKIELFKAYIIDFVAQSSKLFHQHDMEIRIAVSNAPLDNYVPQTHIQDPLYPRISEDVELLVGKGYLKKIKNQYKTKNGINIDNIVRKKKKEKGGLEFVDDDVKEEVVNIVNESPGINFTDLFVKIVNRVPGMRLKEDKDIMRRCVNDLIESQIVKTAVNEESSLSGYFLTEGYLNNRNGIEITNQNKNSTQSTIHRKTDKKILKRKRDLTEGLLENHFLTEKRMHYKFVPQVTQLKLSCEELISSSEASSPEQSSDDEYSCESGYSSTSSNL